MKIYTKTGDKGTTSLVGGSRVPKDDARIEAYGTVDELSAFVAYLRDSMDACQPLTEDLREDLRVILNRLMDVEAALASAGTDSHKVLPMKDEWVGFLESRIDKLGEELDPIERFTIPGGNPLVSLSHICRTVCRRAERAVAGVSSVYEIDSNARAYLNRLSDYFYQFGRAVAKRLNITETYWEPDR